MPVSFGCPNCQAVMKISSKVPPGASVKCPSCMGVFPNPAKDRSYYLSRYFKRSSRKKHRHHSGRSSTGLKIKRVVLILVFFLVVGAGGVGAYYLVSKHGGASTEVAKAGPTEKHPTPTEKAAPPTEKAAPPTEKAAPPTEKKATPPPDKPMPPPDKPMPPEKTFVMSAPEKELFDLVGELRKKEGKKALKANEKLFTMTRAHATAMAKKGEADDELEGKGTAERLTAIGYKIKDIKLVWVNLDVAANLTPAAFFQRCMENAAAKATLLEAAEDVGIGIATNEKQEVYFYVVYAVPE